MSKKKAFSGSTMTLKDFHGGSIPSDLPLPSAPGVTAKTPDRAAAPNPWGAAGRPDLHRPRPGSAGGAGSARGLDERGTPFLPHAANIGRHFEEDERKPFDAAAAAPRRPTTPVPSPLPKRPVSSPVVPHHAPLVPAFHPPSGGAPNAWASKKDLPVEPSQPAAAATVWSGPAAASRLAQASAIEKVSSGRWHSKPQPDVEVIRFHEPDPQDQKLVESMRIVDEGDQYYESERGMPRVAGNYFHVASEREGARSPVYAEAKERAKSPIYQESKERNASTFYPEVARPASNDERYLTGIRLQGARDQEKMKSPVYPESKEKNGASFYLDATRPASNEGRSTYPHLPQQGIAEVPERPKLKLLPRTKPLEPSETLALEEKQGSQPLVEPVHIEKSDEPYGSMNVARPVSSGSNVARPVSSGTDTGGQAVERPRLNLKPRSQTVEQSLDNAEKARKALFGGARPRELVLKQRGVDTVAVDNFDITSPSSRVKNDVPKLESAAFTAQRVERPQNYLLEQRNVHDLEKKDYRPNSEKVDGQRSSWKNENRRSPKEMEKPMEPRRQEPDSWRKPVEQPKPEAPGLRLGKAASAMELAQAFSKPVSDPRSGSRATSASLPGRSQATFSRLTGSREIHSGPSQRQINGY